MSKIILITNDDGITAGGLRRLAEAAKSFGKVYVVAPDSQRSAASHCITLHDHIDIFPADYPVEGVRAFSCSGTPADCIRVGALSVLPSLPDIVLSGINNGYNVASDIQYSGTVGAAFEGAFQGILSIALSEGDGVSKEVCDTYLVTILEELMAAPRLPGAVWNVNFPDCPLSECKGILKGRTVSTGMVFRDSYKETEKLKDNGVRYMVCGEQDKRAEEGTDLRAVMDGYVSIGRVFNLGYEIQKE